MATEKRLIDANVLIEEINQQRRASRTSFPKRSYVVGDVLTSIYNAPIADAVEVVRCKDCREWCYEYDNVGLCTVDVPDIDGVQRYADDFCSYGERRTDG